MMTRAFWILLASAACSSPAKSTPATTPSTTTSGTESGTTATATPSTGTTDPAQGEPACPAIQVKAPDSISAGTAARISVSAVGSPSTTTYKWSVSAGKVNSGQGTSMIMVDTKGLSGASVTATVELGGLSKQCATTTGSATLLVGP